MSDGGTRNEDIARRLVALRDVLDVNQTAFAKLIGTTASAINNYEAGLRQVSLPVAQRIVAKTGVTLDWIYSGNRSGLPGHLLAKLPDLSDRRSA